MIQRKLDPPYKGFQIGDLCKIVDGKSKREQTVILRLVAIDRNEDRIGLKPIKENGWFYLAPENIRKLTDKEFEKVVKKLKKVSKK